MKLASTLPEDRAPSAALDHLKPQAAPTRPRAPPQQRGSLPWPQEPASGRPKVEDSPLSTTRPRDLRAGPLGRDTNFRHLRARGPRGGAAPARAAPGGAQRGGAAGLEPCRLALERSAARPEGPRGEAAPLSAWDAGLPPALGQARSCARSAARLARALPWPLTADVLNPSCSDTLRLPRHCERALIDCRYGCGSVTASDCAPGPNVRFMLSDGLAIG